MDREIIAKQAAATFWKCAPEEVSLTDLSAAKFPWSKRHAFFMGMDGRRRRLLVVVDDTGAPTAFEPVASVTKLDAARFNLVNLNLVLLAEAAALPSGLDLPWTARATLAGLGGWVASPAFWDQEKAAIAMWTHKKPVDGPELFQRHCKAPRPVIRDDGGWTIEFEYFNLLGGVESWSIAGTRREVKTARATVALANGTFLVPYA